jgi:hypothetical protein
MSQFRNAIFILLVCSPLFADGLSTSFVDVQADGVLRGAPYEVHSSRGPGLYLTNLGNTSINVKVDALIPKREDLQKGALAIPDVRWIRIEPDHLELAPHAQGICHIFIAVPKKSVYKNKTYQVMIWSRSDIGKTSGVGLGAGLLSRLRFRTK